MALAIEPMVMLGGQETVLLDDGWTVVTADGSWAAHFEHTVAITPDGPWVLTAEDGGRSGSAILEGRMLRAFRRLTREVGRGWLVGKTGRPGRVGRVG